MQIPQLIYCVASFGLLIYLTKKAERKWFLSAILFWLLSTPILGNPNYTVSLGFAGFDLQPNRILFLFLLAMFFLLIIQARASGNSLLEISVHRFRSYELWMVIYIGIAILINVINVNELGLRTVIVTTVKFSTYLLVYFFARECMSIKDFQLFLVALIFYAVLSSLVGLYQFFGDPSFFRLGVTRLAFGSYIRANGLFFSEYDQGLFLTLVLIVGMLTVQSTWGKALIVTFFSLGVLFTMHRGSWLIFIIALGVIVMKDFHKFSYWIFISTSVAIITLFIVLNVPIQNHYTGSFLDQLINIRVKANTLGDRALYNQSAIYMIPKYPLGLGGYTSGIYIEVAHKTGIPFADGRPLIIHNGYLAAGVLYGVAGMIVFVFFIFTTLIYYLQKKLWSTNIGFMIVLIMISYLLINMTQDYSSIGDQLGLFLGLLLGAAVSLNPGTENSFPIPVEKHIVLRQPR